MPSPFTQPHMKNYCFLALVLLATALVSCKNQNVQSSCDEPVSFVYNEPFELCQGNTAYWAENNEFSIVFKEVTADSRCPFDVNVNCIWSGRVEVSLRFNNIDQVFNDTIANGDITDPYQTEFAGRTIRLLGVSPESTLYQTIPQNEYKITLVVE